MHDLNLMYEDIVHGVKTAYFNSRLRKITWCLEHYEWYVARGASWVDAPVTCIGCLGNQPDLMNTVKLTLEV